MVFLQNPEPFDEWIQPHLAQLLERYKSFTRWVGSGFSKGESAMEEETVAVVPLCTDVRWMCLGDRARRSCLLQYQK